MAPTRIVVSPALPVSVPGLARDRDDAGGPVDGDPAMALGRACELVGCRGLGGVKRGNRRNAPVQLEREAAQLRLLFHQVNRISGARCFQGRGHSRHAAAHDQQRLFRLLLKRNGRLLQLDRSDVHAEIVRRHHLRVFRLVGLGPRDVLAQRGPGDQGLLAEVEGLPVVPRRAGAQHQPVEALALQFAFQQIDAVLAAEERVNLADGDLELVRDELLQRCHIGGAADVATGADVDASLARHVPVPRPRVRAPTESP
jgi:hypothetical protein